jgi:hypothetical protein
MLALILAISLTAPGDPQVAWPVDSIQLTAGQRTTLVTQIMARATTGVVAAQLNRLDCMHVGDQVCCTPFTYDPLTGAAIHALLIAGETWSPGAEPSTQSKRWDPFCLVNGEVAGFDTFVRNISAEMSSGPVIDASFVRTPGTVNVAMSGRYKRSLSAADCATYSDRTLIPVGIE